MTSSVLSTVTDLTYSEFIWWWLHHSDGPNRMAVMLGSYYDESSVDGNGPVAAVGGLLLNKDGYSRLTADWYKVLSKHPRLPLNSDGRPYIHMKDFGADGPLHDYPEADRRFLFSDLATIVNRRKAVSIGATVLTESYRYSSAVFRKTPTWGFHTLCFILTAIQQAKFLHSKGYEYDVAVIDHLKSSFSELSPV